MRRFIPFVGRSVGHLFRSCKKGDIQMFIDSLASEGVRIERHHWRNDRTARIIFSIHSFGTVIPVDVTIRINDEGKALASGNVVLSSFLAIFHRRSMAQAMKWLELQAQKTTA